MNKNVLIVGTLGFPFSGAVGQKCLLLGKAMNHVGINNTVLLRRGNNNKEIIDKYDIKSSGKYQGVNYYYCSGTPLKPQKFVQRNLLKIKGLFNEVFYILKNANQNKYTYLLVYSGEFHHLFFYYLLSKIKNIGIVLLYVEKYSSLYSNKSGIVNFRKIVDNLYESIGFKMMDYILPITKNLENFVKQKCKTPTEIIPMITDLSRYENIPIHNNKEKYFLFCGGLYYWEIIEFQIRAFEKLNRDDVFLYLVVFGGKPENEIKLRTIVNNNKKIKIFKNLTDFELSEKYINATGLLLPMRHNEQDKYRFPHKIGEYLGTKVPIVTNSFGVINEYFQDGVNAYVAENYDVDEFSQKMEELISNPEKSKAIGLKGYKLAEEIFDYKLYGQVIKKVFNNISYNS